MGEPERQNDISREIDKKIRLPAPDSFEKLTPKQRDFQLALAVAASACVPGLFHPLAVSDMYDKGVRVQLVDGGVHDNQGTQALLDKDCTHMIISDASGQMDPQLQPPTTAPGVLLRANSILQDRIRDEQLYRLMERGDLCVALLHLRKGLQPSEIAYLNENDEPSKGAHSQAKTAEKLLPFGVLREVQELLAKIRTDLNSFSEVEAYSLMFDAYLMTDAEFKHEHLLEGFGSFLTDTQGSSPHPWAFFQVEDWLSNPSPRYLRHLKAARHRVFRIQRINKGIFWGELLAGAAGLGLFVWIFREPIWAVVNVKWSIAGTLAAAGVVLAFSLLPFADFVFRRLGPWRTSLEFLLRLTLRAIVPAALSWVVWILLFFDRQVFQRLGSIASLSGDPASTGSNNDHAETA